MTKRFSWCLNKPVPQFSPAEENKFGNADLDAYLHRTCHCRAPFEHILPPLAENRRGLPLPRLSTRLSETLSAQLTQRAELIRKNCQIVQQIHSQFKTLNSLRFLKQTCSNKELIVLSGRPSTVAGITADSAIETFQRDGCSRKSHRLTDQTNCLMHVNAAILDHVNCLEQASGVDTSVSWQNDFSLSIPKCSKQGGLGSVTDTGSLSTSGAIPGLV